MEHTVRENLLQIQEDIAPYKPNIIAVTKYFDENAIIEAYNAGLRDFAESRVIDAVAKINNLPAGIKNNSRFHFIGHLQPIKSKKQLELLIIFILLIHTSSRKLYLMKLKMQEKSRRFCLK